MDSRHSSGVHVANVCRDNSPFAAAPETDKRIVHRLIVWLPIIVVLSFVWGYQQGIADLKSIAEPFVVQLKSGESQSGVLLRTFDKGLLVRDIANQQVEFVRWEEIKKMYRLSTGYLERAAIVPLVWNIVFEIMYWRAP